MARERLTSSNAVCCDRDAQMTAMKNIHLKLFM